MRIHRNLRLATAVAAISFLAASPALAQGKGKEKKENKGRDRGAAVQQQRQRPILQRRTDSDRRDDRYEERSNDRYPARTADRYPEASRDRYPDRDDDRYDDRRDVRIYDGRRAGVPPGWCKGRGNPHNTPENCGYSSNGRYDPRGNDRYGGNDRYDGYRSYAEAHAAFHRDLDRRYDRLADQRRGDLIYQIRLRSEKATEHNRWHERTGTRH